MLAPLISVSGKLTQLILILGLAGSCADRGIQPRIHGIVDAPQGLVCRLHADCTGVANAVLLSVFSFWGWLFTGTG